MALPSLTSTTTGLQNNALYRNSAAGGYKWAPLPGKGLTALDRLQFGSERIDATQRAVNAGADWLRQRANVDVSAANQAADRSNSFTDNVKASGLELAASGSGYNPAMSAQRYSGLASDYQRQVAQAEIDLATQRNALDQMLQQALDERANTAAKQALAFPKASAPSTTVSRKKR